MNEKYPLQGHRLLEQRIPRVIEGWHQRDEELDDASFNELALQIFAYQLQHNEPYANYCAVQGATLDAMPESWEAIPPVPAQAFKEAALATFDPAQATLSFETSGTTRGTGGRHFMQTSTLYDAALLAGFDHFMLPDRARLRYLNLVPNPAERPHSSLGYMMSRVSEQRGDGNTGWYVRGEELLVEGFLRDLHLAQENIQAVCIATTAFALAQVLDATEERGLRFALPQGSRVMETGGFKGRIRVVSRDQLYARAAACFGIPEDAIVAEYGMTELTSQYYDAVPRLRAFGAPLGMTSSTQTSSTQSRETKHFRHFVRDDNAVYRVKASPPWLRARVVGPDGTTLPDGVVGALVHVDLANLWSCLAVQTEDLGARVAIPAFGEADTRQSAGIVLIGREEGAALRGCSLDAEALARS